MKEFWKTGLAVVALAALASLTSCPRKGRVASAPTTLPSIRPGRNRRFCSAVPLRTIWLMHRLEWAP
mgnify:CR=1 FL=1